jgi:hypothetical protein
MRSAASLGFAIFGVAAAAEGAPLVLHRTAEFSAGGAAGATKFAVSWTPLLGLFDDRLRLGLGARLSTYLLSTGLSFGDPNAKLVAPDLQAIALNAFVQARVRIVRELELGANIDVFGYGFGSSVWATYQAPSSSFAPNQAAHVSHLDLLQPGSADRGQLDSEFFVGYRFGQIGLRAGFTHFSLELTTKMPLDGGKDRFRHAFSGGFAAVSYWH